MARKWTKDTVWQESMKYSSRSEFKKNSSGAFRIAYINTPVRDSAASN